MKTVDRSRALALLFLAIISYSCTDDEPIRPVNRLEPKAGDDREVSVNTLVILDGTASKDGGNKPFNFEWKFKSRPVNSTAVLQESHSAVPTFIPDVPGLYKVELRITQNEFFKTDEVLITAKAFPDPQEPIVINGTIASDQVLEDKYEDPAKADYIVTGDIIVGAKLTVSPGVVIEFDSDKSMQIYPEGSLVAKGSSTERIFFTGKVKEKGYWRGLAFFSNNPENELEHVTVDHAGGNPLPEMGNIKTGVALIGNYYSGAAIKISNSTFTESGGYGIYVKDRAQINHFSGNYFTSNAGSALFVPAAQLHQLDFHSHYSGNNGFDGVETGGPVNLNEEVSWSSFNDGSKYLVAQDIHIESGVKITEGATFEFSTDRMVKVTGEGYFNAIGSEFEPIVFTAQNKTADKFWKGIIITSGNDMNRLQFAIVSHAGFSALPELNVKANIIVTGTGKLSVLQSRIEHGLGWGIVADEGSQINQDFISVNSFSNLAAGNYKTPANEPETTSLTGEWVDEWSFQNEHHSIAENYFNKITGAWFNGAADPWSMSPASGFGLKINVDGSYVWTIAEHSPSTGCISYSAEYITGTLTAQDNQISFNESYWRSKFYNACDPEQNVDFNVQPGEMALRFEINRMYDIFTGSQFWALKIINPDGSFFTYYKL